MKKSNLLFYTAIMTAVNLIMRSVGVSFNAYLTNKIGTSGIGLFQLVMTVYSLAVTFSCAGIRLATTRIAVEANTLNKNDMSKSLTLCITYAGICGSVIGFILFTFSDLISVNWINSQLTSFPLKILALSLPFVAMSSSLGGYFTAVECIPQYSCIQLIEQGFKIAVVVYLINKSNANNPLNACISIVTGMTASEILSFSLSMILKRIKNNGKSNKSPINITEILRIAVPDAVGACARSILLTIEHLLIPKGLQKSGVNATLSLSAYGCIHGMAMPILLYPSAVLSSLASLLIPNLAKFNELGDVNGIKRCVARNLRRTIIFSIICAASFFLFSSPLSVFFYKTKEAAKYIKILSPLIPIMYTDMITDGMLKGLDQQVYSMRYNIFDSALCVGLVWILLPKYSVNGYIFILYISEIINFALSINRLKKICGADIRYFQELGAEISTFSRLKKCSVFPSEYGYQTYRGRKKRSQVL